MAARPGEDKRSQEQRFIDGLLERQLFSLAVTACHDRLKSDALTDLEQATTTIDLSRTYTAWALQSKTSKQDSYWKQATMVLKQWEESHPQSPFLPLVQRESIHLLKTRGEFARGDSQASLDPESALQTARQYLGKSRQLAKQVLVTVQNELRAANRDPDHLSNEALMALEQDLKKTLAQTWIAQAECFKRGSPNRIDALQRAEVYIRPLAAKTAPVDWESRLLLLTFLRLSGKVALFRTTADAQLEQSPPDDVVVQIYIEKAKDLLANQHYRAALDLLSQLPDCCPQLRAKVDFLELELFLAAAKTAAASATVTWNERALHQLKIIESNHDPYWMRRARALLGRQMTEQSSGQPSRLLAQAADGLYQAGQAEEAIDAYDRAAKKAKAEGDREAAFELGRNAAAIEHARKQYQEASRRFLLLAENYGELPEAAEVHLMGIFNLAQALRGSPTSEKTTYRKKLDQHLDLFNEKPTADRARLWLGRLLAAEGQWKQAAEAFFMVNSQSPVYPAAIAAAVPCCTQECRDAFSNYSNGKDTYDKWTTLVQNRVDELTDASDKLFDQNDPSAPFVAAKVAQLQMRYLSTKYESALRRVHRALALHGNTDPKIRQQLERLKIQALAGSGDTQSAQEQLQSFEGDLIELIFGIDRMNSGVRLLSSDRRHSRQKLATLQVAAFQKLKQSSTEIDPNDRLALRLIEANALDLLGSKTRALEILRVLATDYPEDGRVQKTYANLLLQQEDKESLETALTKYREIARRSRPQTEGWFRAKYGQATARLKLGDSQKAAQIIQMTRVLHPDLGGEVMRQQFEALLAQCEKKSLSP